MTQVVAIQEPRLPALQAGGSVRAIVPQDFDGAWRIAKAVVTAGMAPKGLDTPEKAMVAILHGMEVGFTPMAALQSIAVINGRPTIWGDGAIGLVRASGKLEWIKEWIDGAGDNRIACCQVKRKGEPESSIYKFSVADAKASGLWTKRGKDGQSTPWQLYPERMLSVRPRSWCLRDTFADVLRGLGIAEEVQDIPSHETPVLPRPPVPPVPPVIAPTTSIEVDAAEAEALDPEAIFKDAGEQFAACDNLETVEEVWEQFEEAYARLSAPDAEHLYGLYQMAQRRHEHES